MRFLLDESVEARVAIFLTNSGHDATRIARDYPAGLPDTDVLATAHREQRILLTNDKDFDDLVFQRRLPPSGVILFRLPMASTAEQKYSALEQLLETHLDELSGLLVVTPRGIRAQRPG